MAEDRIGPLSICDRYDWCDLRRGHTGPCLDDYGQDLAPSSDATDEKDDQQDDQDQEQHATQTDVHDNGLPQ